MESITSRINRRALIEARYNMLQLTDAGRQRAASTLRKHRLWENYLVTDAGLSADHVHDTVEQLEHLNLTPTSNATTDPHGRNIPPK